MSLYSALRSLPLMTLRLQGGLLRKEVVVQHLRHGERTGLWEEIPPSLVLRFAARPVVFLGQDLPELGFERGRILDNRLQAGPLLINGDRPIATPLA